MIRPHPDCWLVDVASTSALSVPEVNRLAFLMNRRNTVSVTPAIGASTVAGAIRTPPMAKLAGTRPCSGIAYATGSSHRFCSSVYRFFIP